ncbi:DUF4097 family beta strand repeat-containing protein [Streptomyces sp. NPDC059447]|uniref:DUF4097 family beta strand repeat-containing protein n=1 Tax=Streptomyces sp. NPDC059447 TaxID=3346834 RepID=UPI0036C79417
MRTRIPAPSLRTRAARAAVPSLLAAATASALLTGCTANATETRTEQRSYELSDQIRALDVTNAGGDIEVTAAPAGSKVKVTEIVRFRRTAPATSHSVTSGTLRLTAAGCRETGLSGCGVHLRIEAPQDVSVRLDSTGGDITVRRLAAATSAKTGGGAISIEDSTAEDVVAHTDGGDITARLTAAPKRISATTDGGDVSIRVPAGPYALDVASATGSRNVSVEDAASSPHKLQVHSKGGDVRVDTT